MPAPSKPFTVIANTAIDADSPLTETLMEQFRDNDIHLEEWMGKDYTAAVNHDHDGVNSKAFNDDIFTPLPFLMAMAGGWFSTGSETFVTIFERPFWLPLGKTKLAARVYLRRDSSTATNPVARLRLVGASTTDTGAEVTHTGGTIPGLYALEVSVSAGNRGNYARLHVELRKSTIGSGNVEMSKDAGTPTNDQSLTGRFVA